MFRGNDIRAGVRAWLIHVAATIVASGFLGMAAAHEGHGTPTPTPTPSGDPTTTVVRVGSVGLALIVVGAYWYVNR